jgi:hypothetical protein
MQLQITYCSRCFRGGDIVLKRKYIIVSVLAFCLTASLFIGVTSTREVKAEGTPTVYVDPPSVKSMVSHDFTVDIRIRNLEAASHLNGWRVKLGYHNIILEALDCEEGAFWRGFAGGNGTYYIHSFYPESGYVDVGSVLLGLPDGDHDSTPGEEEDWPYGSGVLATVTFNCTKAGECVLDLYDTLLADADSILISHQVEDGYFMAGSPATFDLNEDGIVDIVDIVIVALAFGAERVDDPEDPRYGEYWHDPPCPDCPH